MRFGVDTYGTPILSLSLLREREWELADLAILAYGGTYERQHVYW
jgi:hypothetical protein